MSANEERWPVRLEGGQVYVGRLGAVPHVDADGVVTWIDPDGVETAEPIGTITEGEA